MSLLDGLEGDVGHGADVVSVDGRSCAADELLGRADRLAADLSGAGAVAVRARADLDTVIAVVAALRGGVPLVPVPDDVGARERDHVLADSGAVLLVGDHGWDDVDLPSVPVPSRPGGDRPRRSVAASSAALIMYTSGTTGPPKGAVLSHAAIASCLDGLADAWAWTADDVLVHGLPLFHVHGLVLGVIGALRRGSRLVHTGRPTPERYAAAGGSLYFGVPTVWGRIAADAAAARSLAAARLLVSGSAPLPIPVFDALRSLTGRSPIERYGMTETLITLSTRHDGDRRPGWVGSAVGDVTTRIVDEDGVEVDHDAESVGELLVAGSCLFDGYHGRPDATASSFAGDWFRTGDSAVVDADGLHRIVGRTSVDVIKCGGFKIGAGEVESSLLGHPSVREAAVVGLPDDDLGQRVVAFVVADQVAGEELIRHVAESLSAHKRPREVRLVDSLPRNAMGKVQKHLLR